MSKVIKIAEEVLKKHKNAFKSLASTDYTFCSNDSCPLKKDCLRSLSNLKVNQKSYLSVSYFMPDKDGKECDHLMEGN